MSQARNEAITQETKKQIEELHTLGFYHSLELPNGEIIPGLLPVDRLRNRLAQYEIPADLRGKRVLDIGAWDGFYTFEMERRGAHVVALDLFRNDKFLLARDMQKSKAEYVVGDICRLSSKDLGRFDIVLFFGVLYHVKHPVMALENVCSMTLDTAYVESYVIDDPADLNAVPVHGILRAHRTARAIRQLVRSERHLPDGDGSRRRFRRGRIRERALESRPHHLPPQMVVRAPERGSGRPEILCVENSITRDHDFSTKRDDYLSRSTFAALRRDFDATTYSSKSGPMPACPGEVADAGGDGWLRGLQASARPRTRLARASPSRPPQPMEQRAAHPVDVPTQDQDAPSTPRLEVNLVTDGKTWDRWRVKAGAESSLSLWARGIPDSCRQEAGAGAFEWHESPRYLCFNH